MAIRGPTWIRLMLALALYNCSVTGDIKIPLNCALPWKGRVTEREFSQLGEWYKMQYALNNVCPTPIGLADSILGQNIENTMNMIGVDMTEQTGQFCCYDLSGNVKCCDFSHFLLFGLICLVPLIVIPCIICRICCSWGTKRNHNGRVLGMPAATSLAFVGAHPAALSSHQAYYIPAGSTPSKPNVYPTNMKHYSPAHAAVPQSSPAV